ncbi:flagellar biosynthesis protein FlaG [Hahella sp. CCB-MM4]|uniref:flagellar protein FlaG n=1 Tax=Hahella sp. (strain CCB-MM4) TaxID=1926491 RepID=UPI000B9AF440|nr:flagellar protein FlaG [Hahella sp. CCB-MM4]OZG73772.1 flagellar biosynthesis protein FlaG [Hahella sp. CCB-MM4]
MNDLKVNDLNTAGGSAKAAAPVAVRAGASSPLTEPGAKSGGGAASPAAVSPKQASSSASSVSKSDAVSRQEPQKGQTQGNREQLKEAVSRLNDYIQSVQRDLQFELDDDTGRTVVRVLDRQTQEVVRQIPDDVALKLARNLQYDEPISLFDAKA